MYILPIVFTTNLYSLVTEKLSEQLTLGVNWNVMQWGPADKFCSLSPNDPVKLRTVELYQ